MFFIVSGHGHATVRQMFRFIEHRRVLPFDDSHNPGSVSQSNPKSCGARCGAEGRAGLAATERGRVTVATSPMIALGALRFDCLSGKVEWNLQIDPIALFDQRGVRAVGPWVQELDSHDSAGWVKVDAKR
jgi:hypothetical protein